VSSELTISQLKKLETKCRQQLSLMPSAHIDLMFNGHWGKTDCRYLLGVKGKIVQEYDYGILVLFPAKELLEHIEIDLQLKQFED